MLRIWTGARTFNQILNLTVVTRAHHGLGGCESSGGPGRPHRAPATRRHGQPQAASGGRRGARPGRPLAPKNLLAHRQWVKRSTAHRGTLPVAAWYTNLYSVTFRRGALPPRPIPAPDNETGLFPRFPARALHPGGSAGGWAVVLTGPLGLAVTLTVRSPTSHSHRPECNTGRELSHVWGTCRGHAQGMFTGRTGCIILCTCAPVVLSCTSASGADGTALVCIPPPALTARRAGTCRTSPVGVPYSWSGRQGDP
jgi:hypothetical protein